MEAIHDRVAGLDVHKDTVVACVRSVSGNKATRECRTFATTTDGLLELIARLDLEGRADKARFSHLTGLLASIPGVSKLSAVAILSEIGTDMSRFDTAGHLIAWAGLCPGQNESAGKRKRTRLRKGAPWLKTMLVQCAGRLRSGQTTATTRRSSSAGKPDAARKKRSAPSQPRS